MNEANGIISDQNIYWGIISNINNSIELSDGKPPDDPTRISMRIGASYTFSGILRVTYDVLLTYKGTKFTVKDIVPLQARALGIEINVDDPNKYSMIAPIIIAIPIGTPVMVVEQNGKLAFLGIEQTPSVLCNEALQ